MATVVNFTTLEKFLAKIQKLGADHNLDFKSQQTTIVRIAGSPTGGTFNLLYDNESGGINYNATYTALITVLNSMAEFTAGDILGVGGPLPDTEIELVFAGNFLYTAMHPWAISANNLTGGSDPQIYVETKIRGFNDEAIAQRRLEEAYNEIMSKLIARGLTATQVSTWVRGEEFQLDIATFWLAKDYGWGGRDEDEIDWTKVFDRRAELDTVAVVNNDDELLLSGKGIAVGMDLLDINETLGYRP